MFSMQLGEKKKKWTDYTWIFVVFVCIILFCTLFPGIYLWQTMPWCTLCSGEYGSLALNISQHEIGLP
jgi:hypothetical protein